MADGKSRREAEMQKVFPEAKEKLLKDYKCSLYLDIHHPGHLFITQNNMYFYSTKNITDPLPNPLAVHSLLNELTGIEKSGIDGIVIKKGEEEIVLDSFQYRDEAFDNLYRFYLLSKGEKAQPVTGEKKEEYKPLDLDIKELMKRTLDGLPFFNDLGLLAINYDFHLNDKPIFEGRNTSNLKNYERLKKVLFTISKLLMEDKQIPKIEEAFDKYFANADDAKVKYSISPPTVIEFLKENYGEDHIVVKFFKACIHPITTAVLRIKNALTSFFPTKDLKWGVFANVTDKSITILHNRSEVCINGQFEVEWKMSLTYDRNMKDIQSAWLNVVDLRFNVDTKEPIRYQLQSLLKEFLPVDAKYKNAVILPSFVDLSNQQLSEIPEQILNMTALQTLYIHFNKIDRIPDNITQLTNLQVLYLNQNNLSTFPTIVCKMQNLRELHLGRNRIQQIPPEIGNLVHLRELSLSYNMLNGTLPKELCSLKELKKLYLHNNYLGEIPSELASLPNLKVLQIHNNQKLTGKLKDFGPNDSEEIIEFLKNTKI